MGKRGRVVVRAMLGRIVRWSAVGILVLLTPPLYLVGCALLCEWIYRLVGSFVR